MIQWISRMLVPLIISYIVGFGLLSKRPIFDDFLAGAKDGIRTAADILPTLVGLMTAVGVLRTSGFLDAVSGWLTTPAQWLHLPAPLIPLTLVRLISNSAATGLFRNGSIYHDELYRDCILLYQHLFWIRSCYKITLYIARRNDCNNSGNCGKYIFGSKMKKSKQFTISQNRHNLVRIF